MKTIGKILRDARTEKRYSTVRLENLTRIKKDFIEAIEREDWNSLPPFPTVLGFVKSLASSLSLPERNVVAVLKRDYPPKKLNINPKPDIGNKFVWSPKLTFLVGVGVIVLIIFGYLLFQYVRFISPPHLTVISPRPDQVITQNTILVTGTTDTDVKITVNNQPVSVNEDGSFSVNLDVAKNTTEIDIAATSRSGKSTTVRRKILVTSF